MIPKVNEVGWVACSCIGGLYTILWSSMQSHATWSLANCSLLFRGLSLTVTTIFSSLALGRLGVDTGVLSIFEAGVPGVLTVIFCCRITGQDCQKITEKLRRHFGNGKGELLQFSFQREWRFYTQVGGGRGRQGEFIKYFL